jgi:hypothetical protein
MTTLGSKRGPTSLDVQVLQTAASLENLAVAAYETVLRLLASRGPAALGTFAATCRSQHIVHAAAFNAAAVRAGGAAQHAADPQLLARVHGDLTHPTDEPSAVSLLESLEDINAQSYTRYAVLASSATVREMFVSVAMDEAAHRAFLIAALHLLTDGPAALIAFPTRPAGLPAAVGSECFPHTFYPTADSLAIDAGELR